MTRAGSAGRWFDLPMHRAALTGISIMALVLPVAHGSVVADRVGVVRVAVCGDHLVIEARPPRDGRARLIELQPYERAPSAPPIEIARPQVGKLATARIPRLKGRRDRLFSRFRLIERASEKGLGPARWVDNVAALAQRTFAFPAPRGIKGLQCIVDVDDALHLGVKHAAHNVPLNMLVRRSGGAEAEWWDVDGETIWFNRSFVRQLDGRIRKLTDASVVNTLVIYSYVPTAPDPHNRLIHPRTDLASAPNHVGAFNLSDERGLRVFRAAIEYLADRYSDPRKTQGWVSGFIIGNELQSHWHWYNLGEMSPEAVVAEYARALRVAHLAAHRIHPGIRLYISLDHHWTARATENPKRSMGGKRFLELLDHTVGAEGDLPWHVAFHSYPEDLRDPRTWEDRAATHSFETPKITFKNIEVLPAFLRQKPFLYQGTARRILLSEQGFHLRAVEQGELEQAAAYAYAYHRVRQVDGIDGFILHRHVDYPGEGGLRLGLRASRSDRGSVAGRKRAIYDVFRLADTDQWQAAFDFARPVIGIRRWEDLRPKPVADHGDNR